MYYELYVDSLFLVNFVMNLYLLLLTNRSVFRTATRGRIMVGAGMGAAWFVLLLCCPGPWWGKVVCGILPGNIAILLFTFRIRTGKALYCVAAIYLRYTVIFGGAMIVLRRIPIVGSYMSCIWGILGMGALLYLGSGYWSRMKSDPTVCSVTVYHRGNKITLTALVDSGNALVEPVSGRPVSVVSRETIRKVCEAEPEIYRPIPYRSIGKTGILKGYRMDRIEIEQRGITKICKDVYVAVPEAYTASEGMILNPLLLQE